MVLLLDPVGIKSCGEVPWNGRSQLAHFMNRVATVRATFFLEYKAPLDPGRPCLSSLGLVLGPDILTALWFEAANNLVLSRESIFI